jgi:hypothetical protein
MTESQKQQITAVAGELSAAIREQARGRWKRVRTAERNEQGRRVWRFRAGPGQGERFLHVEHRAMGGSATAGALLQQLEAGHWLDQLQGTGAAVLLSRDGSVTPLAV